MMDLSVDILTTYRRIIQDILNDHARTPYAYEDVHTHTVFDVSSDHYMLINVGWDGPQRVHACLAHIDLIDGKFWIQRDGTERGLAREVEAAGVPKDHIVLAFRSPEIRPFTEYAVA